MDVKEEDIKSFGLNFGEKRRVKNLLSSLSNSRPGILELHRNPSLECHRTTLFFWFIVLAKSGYDSGNQTSKLEALQRILLDVRARWDGLGVDLNIPKDTLKVCSFSNSMQTATQAHSQYYTQFTCMLCWGQMHNYVYIEIVLP